MPRIASLFVLFGFVLAGWPAAAVDPLKVLVRPASGPHFVGQAIEVRVEVDGATADVQLESPKTGDFEVFPLVFESKSPEIGRFLIVPKRAGLLEIGSFRARAGDRSGSSRPGRLTVANIPTEGRSAAFLGGVGAFEVQAGAEPTQLRAGQTLEFRITLRGPAAWGSLRRPDLSPWASLAGGLRVEPLEDHLEGIDPPNRVFRYRLRPSAAGRVVLPPVAIAAFEPRTGRFLTRSTSSVAILVEQPPGLDPSTLDYRPVATERGSRWNVILLGFSGGFVGILALGYWFFARNRKRRKVVDPARLAVDLSRTLATSPTDEPARQVTEALASYLEQVSGRPPGVLTPLEASEAFEQLTGDRDLAETARRIVLGCDRVRYRGNAENSEELIEEGRAFFEKVGEVISRGEGGPREAAETA